MFSYKAAIIVGVVALSGSAFAQGVEFGPNGVRIEPNARERLIREDRRDERDRSQISQRDAVQIAKREGVADVESVRPSRDGWTIDGTDRRGADILVRVASNGDVIDVRR